jgi:hypothetical protein
MTTPLSLYGVQLNLSLSSIPIGWSLCYTGAYAASMAPSAVATILASCNQSKLLLGCSPVNSTILTVAAMGNRADVLYNCSTLQNCTNVANGVGWYYGDSWSWGFVQGGDVVVRNSCDVGSYNTSYRLCWHTQSGGGYRCGATTSFGTNWVKFIYQAS